MKIALEVITELILAATVKGAQFFTWTRTRARAAYG